MTDEPTPQNFMQQMTGSPMAWFVAVVVAGGGGSLGSSFLTNSGDAEQVVEIRQEMREYISSNNAVLDDLRMQIIQAQNSRDLQHEQDHFWIACKRGLPQCAGMSVDEANN